VWILQTLPAIFLALYIRWLDRWAILVGWLVGIIWGTYGMIQGGFANGGVAPPDPFFSTPLYVGFYSLVANLIIVFVGSALARLLGSQQSYGPLTQEN
jgi:SSS family solute:Na+ symporter